MNSQYLQKVKLPDTPGIYFFLNNRKKILYIGMATSLRSRVRSYFARDIEEVRSPLIKQMVEEASSIDYRKTDSVLEALILEVDLIKKFQPKYNSAEKDDKSFNCVVITKEDFPRIKVVRKHGLKINKLEAESLKLKAIYGPFPNGTQLRDALKIVRKIFPYRDDKCLLNQGKPCFNRQIGLCPGVCTGEITKLEYARIIGNIKLFFSGKKTQIIRSLKKEMNVLAKTREFEKADKIKKTIFALQHIRDVSLIKSENLQTLKYESQTPFRIEAYDIAHLSGTNSVGVMTVIENCVARKSDYRKFKIKGGFGNNDVASLKEVIERRFKHSEWMFPSLVVADGGIAQKNVIEEVLSSMNIAISVVAVTKNDKHKPEKIIGSEGTVKEHEREILLSNAEAHRFALAFHQKRRSTSLLRPNA
ncbi:MAG: hypothetical protein EXS59_01195 [Candidatus Taylorbacteria bacterium]|nr:hypothetical protein [Candidatus Taylorbacteria bacterium]